MSHPAPLRNAVPTRNTAMQAASSVTPRLSVLIPFYKDSPLPLLSGLTIRDPHSVEIILLDDGSGDEVLTARIRDFMAKSPMAMELITLGGNEGRARGRNRLTAAARGDYFLLLDADMLPDGPDFLDNWLKQLDSGFPAVVFGGFSLNQAPRDKSFTIHRLMAGHSDCLKAAARSRHPEKYVFTSNLLVRRDVFQAEGFDSGFTGWGWEDVEWAMRVAAHYPVEHIDNTATHMGLDTIADLARKYEQSVSNFARVLSKHPHIVTHYPSYRVARMFRKLPGVGVWCGLLKLAALVPLLP
ncbi:MAG: glycosyltransferase family 2 protein, partial [Asticcacaulis sp.]